MRVTGRFETEGDVGVLRLTAQDSTKPVFQRVHWMLTIDESGSMDEMCKGGKTKAQLVSHTLKNMLKYFRRLSQEHGIQQKLTLIFFDHEQRVFNYDLATEQAFEEASNQVESLSGKGLTDIESVLRVAKSEISSNCDASTRVIHILMTDGLPTSGNCRREDLISIAERCRGTAECGIYTAYLGYGADHDSKLMDGMASAKADEKSCGMYQFVESHENAGMAYGEAAYNGLYEAATGIRISLEGAEVYDFIDADWTTELLSGSNLPSGSEKTWTIRRTGGPVRYTVSCIRWGGEDFVTVQETGYIDRDDHSISDDEVRKYDLRQKTMALVHRCLVYRNKIDESRSKGGLWGHEDDPPPARAGAKRRRKERGSADEVDSLRGDIKQLMEVIIEYKGKLDEDQGGFLGNLLDDLQVARAGLCSSNGWQYMQMRIASQGEQRLYNPTDLSELDLEEEINLVSQVPMSAYKSPGAAVMRECSQH